MSSELFFYHIVVLKQKSPLLTYCSAIPLNNGVLVEIPLLNQKVQGVVLQSCQAPNFECKEAIPLEFHFSKAQCALAEFIASYYCAARSLAFSLFTPFENGFKEEKQSLSFPLKPLNQRQEEALKFLVEKQDALLFGDTGSGKTEIYIHCFARILQQGKNVLFLMPEISLTPQMEKRLSEIFGSHLAFWHSKITQKKKREILQRLKNGEVRILAGARSALFLPLANLGLIVIDEEHDDAYKSSSSPRYHARDVALYLAKSQKIPIILGSATPLVTTYYRAKNTKSIFRLQGTHFKTHKEYFFNSSAESLDDSIVEALEQNFKSSKQAVVFLPTRANFKHLFCVHCHQGIECQKCSISLSLHTKDSSLKCHYCHFTCPIPKFCPNCGGELRSFRMGTQEFATKLQELLPESKIACFDRDSITTQTKLAKTLSDFNHHKIDILVGTQMLSKGHDYHNVALSVALGLDYLLKGSDYRARERALSLMFQLSGRSGRKESGKVLVQTFYQDFFQCYLRDYALFLEDELVMRANLYPPFVRLALVHFNHKKQEIAQNLMQEALEILQTQIQTRNIKVEIVGSGEAPIERIAGKWRFVILLRSSSAKDLHCALLPLRLFSCEIDIDPIEFY